MASDQTNVLKKIQNIITIHLFTHKKYIFKHKYFKMYSTLIDNALCICLNVQCTMIAVRLT